MRVTTLAGVVFFTFVFPARQHDLVTQELALIREDIAISEKRILLLKQLKERLADVRNDSSDEDESLLNERTRQLLTTPLRLDWNALLEAQAAGGPQLPVALPEDYLFLRWSSSAASSSVAETRPSAPGASRKTSFVVFERSVQTGRGVSVASLDGEILLESVEGAETVSEDELGVFHQSQRGVTFFLRRGSSEVRVFELSVEPTYISEEEKRKRRAQGYSAYLGQKSYAATLRRAAKFELSSQLNSGTNNITDFVAAHSKFYITDDTGGLTILTKNGSAAIPVRTGRGGGGTAGPRIQVCKSGRAARISENSIVHGKVLITCPGENALYLFFEGREPHKSLHALTTLVLPQKRMRNAPAIFDAGGFRGMGKPRIFVSYDDSLAAWHLLPGVVPKMLWTVPEAELSELAMWGPRWLLARRGERLVLYNVTEGRWGAKELWSCIMGERESLKKWEGMKNAK